MRKRQEPGRESVGRADLLRAHLAQLFPGHATRQLHAHAFLHKPTSPRHPDFGRAIGQIVALVQERALALHHTRLVLLVSRLDCVEALFGYGLAVGSYDAFLGGSELGAGSRQCGRRAEESARHERRDGQIAHEDLRAEAMSGVRIEGHQGRSSTRAALRRAATATATACKEDIDAVEGPSSKSYSLRV